MVILDAAGRCAPVLLLLWIAISELQFVRMERTLSGGDSGEALDSEFESMAAQDPSAAPPRAGASTTGAAVIAAAAAAASSSSSLPSNSIDDAMSPLYQSDPWSNAADYYESLDLSFDDIADLDRAESLAAASASSSSSQYASAAAAAASSSLHDPNDEALYPTCKKGDPLGESSAEESYILGTLIVRVVAARNLSVVDSTGLAQAVGGILFGGARTGAGGSRGGAGGSVNPYASVRFGNTTQRTSQVFGTPDPIWPRAEAMYLDVTHPTPLTVVDAVTPPSANSKTSGFAEPSRPIQGKDRAQMKTSEAGAAVDYWTDVDPPVLTVGIFHSNADMSLKKQKYSHGDSNDVFLGMATVNLTHLLTGKSRFDEWLPLQGGPASSTSSYKSSVRLVCEYEPSDPPPHKGDVVQFTRFCRPCDLYPLSPFGTTFTVEEGCNDSDLVLIQSTSREGWVSSFLVHRFMLLVVDRHYGAMDLYQEEMLSIAQRLSHSPMLNVLQESAQRLDNEGLVQVGAAAVQGGVALLGRWFHGGLETVAQDLAFATNWDGRFNPDAETSLATNDVASPTAAAGSERACGTPTALELPEASDYDDPDAVNAKPALPNMPSCPITQEPMRDPVVAADGHTYERSAIVRWLQTSDKSPLTGSVLPHKNLVPNYMLLSSLQEQAAAAAVTQSFHNRSILVETVEEESDLDDETTEVQID